MHELLEHLAQALLLGHVGAQVVQRVADLAGDAAHVVAQLVQGIGDAIARLVAVDQAVQLEAQVGERLADAVVQVTGDAGPLLVRADGAEPGEPAGVVERERSGGDEPLDQLQVAHGEVVEVAVLDGEQADDRTACGEHRVDARSRS